MKHPSDEETKLLRDYFLLPLVMAVFERDRKAIEASQVKFKTPYLQLLDRCFDQAQADHVAVKRAMRVAGLKVIGEERGELDLRAQYMYRGYHHEATYLWALLGAECEERMKGYLAGEKV